jgi:hypothetical protein
MWPYDVWENYRPIFELARAHGYRVLAVDSDRDECDTLHGRDSYAGWRIAEHLHKDPTAKVMVLIGELHLAPAHLPTVVRENLAKLGQTKSHVLVHQNCEEIYWQLSQAGLAETEVVRVDDDGWCVVNTPPIVRQQSYLNWLDFDEKGLEYGHLTDHFGRSARSIAAFLEMPPSAALDDLTVYGPGETDFVELFGSRGRYPPGMIDALKARIAAGKSFHLPQERLVYLARLTTNHAIEEAAHFVSYASSGRTTAWTPASVPYAHMLDEAVGFFGSKVLNHKRKALQLGHFLRQIRRAQAGQETVDDHEIAAARLVVIHKSLERGAPHAGGPGWTDTPPSVVEAALQSLGYMLGERLYYGLVGGRVSRAEVRALFGAPLEGENEAKDTYFRWAGRLAGVKIPARI